MSHSRDAFGAFGAKCTKMPLSCVPHPTGPSSYVTQPSPPHPDQAAPSSNDDSAARQRPSPYGQLPALDDGLLDLWDQYSEPTIQQDVPSAHPLIEPTPDALQLLPQFQSLEVLGVESPLGQHVQLPPPPCGGLVGSFWGQCTAEPTTQQYAPGADPLIGPTGPTLDTLSQSPTLDVLEVGLALGQHVQLPLLHDGLVNPFWGQCTAEPTIQHCVPGADPLNEPTPDTLRALPQSQSLKVLEVEPALVQHVQHGFARDLPHAQTLCFCGKTFSRPDSLARHVNSTNRSRGSFVRALPVNLPALNTHNLEISPSSRVDTRFSSTIAYHQDYQHHQDHHIPQIPQIPQTPQIPHIPQLPQPSISSRHSAPRTGPTSGRVRSGRRFPCQFCDKYCGDRSFTRRDHLRQHLKRGHKFNDASVRAHLNTFQF